MGMTTPAATDGDWQMRAGADLRERREDGHFQRPLLLLRLADQCARGSSDEWRLRALRSRWRCFTGGQHVVCTPSTAS